RVSPEPTEGLTHHTRARRLTGSEHCGGPRPSPRFRDPVLVSLEPPRSPGLPGALARLVRLERRHVDARHERRVANDRARALAAHGVAHADGDEPAVLPPGAARRRPRPGARRAAGGGPGGGLGLSPERGVVSRGGRRARTLAPRGAPRAPPARGRAGRDAGGRALRPSLGALSRRPRPHRRLRGAGE